MAADPGRPVPAAAGGRPAAGRALLAGAVLLLALGAFALRGFDGRLSPDNAVLLYAGQRLLEGVPPYASAATIKGPLGQLLAGLGLAAGRAAGWDDVRSARVLFWLLSGATVALVALLGEAVWGSARAGLVAALVVAGCAGYARQAAAGPSYHTAMLLFFAAGLLLTVRRSWPAAGAAGALSFLVWQPSAVVLGATLLLAALEPRRGRALAAVVAGAAVPLAAVAAWGSAAGIGGELATRLLLLGLPLAGGREPLDLAQRLAHPVREISRGAGPWMVAAVPLALAVYAGRLRADRGRHGSWRGALREGRPAAVALAFAPLVAWSLFDFQNFPDFFPLLPAVALAVAFLVERCAAAVGAAAGGRAGALAGAAAAVLLLAGAAASARDAGAHGGGIARQRRVAAEVGRRCGEGCTLVSLGDPASLVLLGRENPNPYVLHYAWVQALLDRSHPGGLAGWLDGLDGAGRLVVLGPVPRARGRRILLRRLREGFRLERAGKAVLYVREARG